MVEVVWSDEFKNEIKKIKDNAVKERIKKQIAKIVNNPEIGKPLRHELKGERTMYIKPYRLIYSVVGDTIYILRFEHRKDVYD